MESELDGQKIVLQNRISFRTYDKIRKSTGLTAKRKLSDDDESPPLRNVGMAVYWENHSVRRMTF